MKLRTNQTSDAKEAKYTFNFDTFEEGTIEELIRVLDTFDIIKEKMPLTTVALVLNMFPTMLLGQALIRWETIFKEKTARKILKTQNPRAPLKQSPSENPKKPLQKPFVLRTIRFFITTP